MFPCRPYPWDEIESFDDGVIVNKRRVAESMNYVKKTMILKKKFVGWGCEQN